MVRKYSYEFKKYLVTLLESGLISANELARRHNIHKGVVCKIYNRYKQFGDKSLQHTYTRNKYSREFKLNVLKYKAENNLSYEQTALHFNIPSVSAIHDWHKLCCEIMEVNMVERNQTNKTNKKNIKAIKDTIKLVNTSEESEEVKQLKERIAELEKELYYKSAENAYLKKLDALMQEKKQKAQEKKRK